MEQRKPMDDTPVGKLPAELRLMIYGFVFNSLQPIRLIPVNRTGKPYSISPQSKPLQRTALLHVCKKIRNKASDAFYSTTIFEIEVDSIHEIVKLPLEFICSFSPRNRQRLPGLTVIFTAQLGLDDLSNTPDAKKGRKKFLNSMVRMYNEAKELRQLEIRYAFRVDALSEYFDEPSGRRYFICDISDHATLWNAQETAITTLRSRMRPWAPHVSIPMIQLCEGSLRMLAEWKDGLRKAAGTSGHGSLDLHLHMLSI